MRKECFQSVFLQSPERLPFIQLSSIPTCLDFSSVCLLMSPCHLISCPWTNSIPVSPTCTNYNFQALQVCWLKFQDPRYGFYSHTLPKVNLITVKNTHHKPYDVLFFSVLKPLLWRLSDPGSFVISPLCCHLSYQKCENIKSLSVSAS